MVQDTHVCKEGPWQKPLWRNVLSNIYSEKVSKKRLIPPTWMLSDSSLNYVSNVLQRWSVLLQGVKTQCYVVGQIWKKIAIKARATKLNKMHYWPSQVSIGNNLIYIIHHCFIVLFISTLKYYLVDNQEYSLQSGISDMPQHSVPPKKVNIT